MFISKAVFAQAGRAENHTPNLAKSPFLLCHFAGTDISKKSINGETDFKARSWLLKMDTKGFSRHVYSWQSQEITV